MYTYSATVALRDVILEQVCKDPSIEFMKDVHGRFILRTILYLAGHGDPEFAYKVGTANFEYIEQDQIPVICETMTELCPELIDQGCFDALMAVHSRLQQRRSYFNPQLVRH